MERYEFVRFASRMDIHFIEMDKEELLEDYKQAFKSLKNENEENMEWVW